MYLNSSTVFTHANEDKWWIALTIPPIKMTALHLELEHRQDIAMFEGYVTEKKFVSLNKEHSPCEDYPNGNLDFMQCCKAKFLDILKDKNLCTIAGTNA